MGGRGADTVHAHLWFNSLDELTLEGRLHPEDTVDLLLEEHGEWDFSVSLSGRHLVVAASRSEGLAITRIEAVRRGPETPEADAADLEDVGVWLPEVRAVAASSTCSPRTRRPPSRVLRFDTLSSFRGVIRHGRPWAKAAETSIVKTGTGLTADVTGDAIQLSVRAESASVDRVAGYLRGGDEQ